MSQGIEVFKFFSKVQFKLKHHGELKDSVAGVRAIPKAPRCFRADGGGARDQASGKDQVNVEER